MIPCLRARARSLLKRPTSLEQYYAHVIPIVKEVYAILEEAGLIFTFNDADAVAGIRFPEASESVWSYNDYLNQATRSLKRTPGVTYLSLQQIERLKHHSKTFDGVRTQNIRPTSLLLPTMADLFPPCSDQFFPTHTSLFKMIAGDPTEDLWTTHHHVVLPVSAYMLRDHSLRVLNSDDVLLSVPKTVFSGRNR